MSENKNNPTVNDFDGWISVKDRLPEENRKYIVFLKDLIPQVVTDVSRVTVDEFENGRWSVDARNVCVVTHWKPMPEPPTDTQIKRDSDGAVVVKCLNFEREAK